METPVTGRSAGASVGGGGGGAGAVETPVTGRGTGVGCGGGAGAGFTILEEGDEEDRGSQLTGTGTGTGDVDEETLMSSKGTGVIQCLVRDPYAQTPFTVQESECDKTMRFTTYRISDSTGVLITPNKHSELKNYRYRRVTEPHSTDVSFAESQNKFAIEEVVREQLH